MALKEQSSGKIFKINIKVFVGSLNVIWTDNWIDWKSTVIYKTERICHFKIESKNRLKCKVSTKQCNGL